MDNIRIWFACFESNNGLVVCKGGFTNAFMADDFVRINDLQGPKSKLISTCKYMPRFMQELKIKRDYNKSFNKIHIEH